MTQLAAKSEGRFLHKPAPITKYRSLCGPEPSEPFNFAHSRRGFTACVLSQTLVGWMKALDDAWSPDAKLFFELHPGPFHQALPRVA